VLSYVIADTLIYNIPHFKMWRMGIDTYHWIKNDSDYVYLYDRYNIDHNQSTIYLKNEKFSYQSGVFDTIYWTTGGGVVSQTRVLVGPGDYLMLFDEVVEYRSCFYQQPTVSATLWCKKI
jgi:hypothetical protein